jgi:hypothetical protein
MSTVPARLAAFAMVLVMAFGGAYAVGSALEPVDESPDATVPVEPAGRPHDEDHGG